MTQLYMQCSSLLPSSDKELYFLQRSKPTLTQHAEAIPCFKLLLSLIQEQPAKPAQPLAPTLSFIFCIKAWVQAENSSLQALATASASERTELCNTAAEHYSAAQKHLLQAASSPELADTAVEWFTAVLLAHRFVFSMPTQHSSNRMRYCVLCLRPVEHQRLKLASSHFDPQFVEQCFVPLTAAERKKDRARHYSPYGIELNDLAMSSTTGAGVVTTRGDCAMLCQHSQESPLGKCEKMFTDSGEAKFAKQFVKMEDRARKQAIHELYMEPLTLLRRACLVLHTMLMVYCIWFYMIWGYLKSFVTTVSHWLCGTYQQHCQVKQKQQEARLQKAAKQERQRRDQAIQESKLNYDSWMYYFAVSLLWRHLIAHADLSHPEVFVVALRMRGFLLQPSETEEPVSIYAFVPPFKPLKSGSCRRLNRTFFHPFRKFQLLGCGWGLLPDIPDALIVSLGLIHFIMPFIRIQPSADQSPALRHSMSYQLASSARDGSFQRIFPGNNRSNPGKRHVIDMAAGETPEWYKQWFIAMADAVNRQYEHGDLAQRHQFVDQQRSFKEKKDFAPLTHPEQRGKILYLFQSLLKHWDALNLERGQ